MAVLVVCAEAMLLHSHESGAASLVGSNYHYRCALQRKGQFATDLHAAVISQDVNALKQLIHKGADLSAKNQVVAQSQAVALHEMDMLQQHDA